MTENEIQKALSSVSLKDKAQLTAGVSPNRTAEKGSFRSLFLCDGPSGIRMPNVKSDSLSGVSDSQPTSVFPVGSCLANSWDEEDFYLEGEAIGKECAYFGVDLLLGPALNIQRNPLCGRNFEYYSEDPLLSGLFAGQFTLGLQRHGAGACLKHYCCNGNEKYRFVGDSIVSRRALSEIYLRNFDYAVRIGHPYAVMTAYNQVNHTFCSENAYLLKDKLRDEFGFQGLVMTDWGGTHNKVEALKNGLNLEMPGCIVHNVRIVKEAVEQGTLKEEELNEAILPMLEVAKWTEKKEEIGKEILDSNAVLAVKFALDGAVLLRNEKDILPLKKETPLAVIGDFFTYMRYQGSGSSMLTPYALSTFESAFNKRGISYEFAQGYEDGENKVDLKKEKEALELAKKKDVIVFFGGLSDFDESEGFDKTSLHMPENQFHLLVELQKLGKPIVFMMSTGTPVDLDGLDFVTAILNLGPAGEGAGEAGTQLLFGEANPSGHLAQTWPLHYEDVPLAKEFTSSPIEYYKDEVYCGYRYYETVNKEVRYPFGYGLSYTTFAISSFEAKVEENKIHFAASIKNTGHVGGKTVLQIYATKPRIGPKKELVSFKKVYLEPQEEKTVEWDCPMERLSSYDASKDRLSVQKGQYLFHCGFSVADTPFQKEISIDGEEGDFNAPLELGISDEEFCKRIGVEYRLYVPGKKPYSLETPISEFSSPIGKIFRKSTSYFGGELQYKKGKKIKDPVKRASEMKAGNFVRRLMPANSLRSLCFSSGGLFTYELALLLEGLVNNHPIQALKNFHKEKKENKRYGK